MIVRRLVLVVTIIAVGSGLLPTPARAGGSWLNPGRSTYVPSQVAIINGSFGSGSYEGEVDDGPFVAYLLPANRWISGRNVPSVAIPVGELVITETGTASLYRAHVRFRVPDVPGGMYHIQYCNLPCTVDGLGDLIGSASFAIGATPTEARLVMRVQQLRWKIQEVAYRARHAASDRVRDVTRELRTVEERLGEAEGRVRELDRAVEELRASLRSGRSGSAATGWIAAALLLGLITCAVLVMSLRKRLERRRLDAELRALTLMPTGTPTPSG
jgi:hypothetical protein